jgi:succinate dehydrogenase / fumarate reductase cytochrome b subunit
MHSVRRILGSTIARKFFMSATGFALVGFIAFHFMGNLSLFHPGGVWFNTYAGTLESLEAFVALAEIGLLAIGSIHIITAVWLKIENMRARPEGYRYRQGTKGGESHKNLSSVNMLITGSVIAGFIIFHVWQFKYGPGSKEGYTVMINGVEKRDLYRLVVETFRQPVFLGLYAAGVTCLGFHLRHGFWSAFQSAAVAYSRFSKPIYAVGVLLSILLAGGFIFMPVWFFFDLARFVP